MVAANPVLPSVAKTVISQGGGQQSPRCCVGQARARATVPGLTECVPIRTTEQKGIERIAKKAQFFKARAKSRWLPSRESEGIPNRFATPFSPIVPQDDSTDPMVSPAAVYFVPLQVTKHSRHQQPAPSRDSRQRSSTCTAAIP